MTARPAGMKIGRTRSVLRVGITALLVTSALAVTLVVRAPSGRAAGAQQPAYLGSLPDPGVVLDTVPGDPAQGRFVVTGTGSRVREITSTGGGGPWTAGHSLLDGAVPTWMASADDLWAPDLFHSAAGWVLYFAAPLRPSAGAPDAGDAPADGTRCLGTAHSARATGPFRIDPHPLVCLPGYRAADDMSADPGDRVPGAGVIDASPSLVSIEENGASTQALYLLYKTQQLPSTIRMVRLDPADGTTTVGTSHQLLRAPAAATYADSVEAPVLVQHDGWFVLFVAHGTFAQCGYETQWYASRFRWAWRAARPTDLLTQGNTGLCGPGGADVTGSKVAGQYRIFFHAWVRRDAHGSPTTTPADSGTDARRVLYANVLTFAGDGHTPLIGPALSTVP